VPKQKEVCEKSTKHSIQVTNEKRVGVKEKFRGNIFDQIHVANWSVSTQINDSNAPITSFRRKKLKTKRCSNINRIF